MISTVELAATLHLQLAGFSGLLLLLKDPSTLTVSASLSYKNLVFTIERENSLYAQATYLIDENSPTLISSYFENPEVEDLLAPHLKRSLPESGEYFIAPLKYEPLSTIVNKYLAIAERIAQQGYLCTSGDDYAPGYFSKMALAAEGILLEQINYMNSRSLAHKTDYSLRDLTFFIPYNPQETKPAGFDEVYIGDMRIHFSDRSSANNKNCGQQIKNQIDEERMKFDSAQA